MSLSSTKYSSGWFLGFGSDSSCLQWESSGQNLVHLWPKSFVSEKGPDSLKQIAYGQYEVEVFTITVRRPRIARSLILASRPRLANHGSEKRLWPTMSLYSVRRTQYRGIYSLLITIILRRGVSGVPTRRPITLGSKSQPQSQSQSQDQLHDRRPRF